MVTVRRPAAALLVATFGAVCGTAPAHHSFAMYDVTKTYVFTGVVMRVNPDAQHLQIFFAPLNDARTAVLRDEKGEPLTWAVEMDGAPQAAKYGVTVNAFPRGTVFSVGLHPLRNGHRAGGRGKSGLFRCPDNAVPQPGQHCDSVPGATSHGEGALPVGNEKHASQNVRRKLSDHSRGGAGWPVVQPPNPERSKML